MDDEPARWTWLDLLRAMAFALAVVAVCAVIVGGGYAALRFAGLSQHLSPLRPYGLGIIAVLLGMLLYGAALLGVLRYSIHKYELPWSALYMQYAGWSRYLAMLGLYVPVQLGAGLIIALQARIAGHALDNPQHGMVTQAEHQHWSNYVGVFLAAAVIAPIVEEVVFRGFFYRLLRKRLPTWAAVPISAAVFAVGHGIPVLIPVLFYLGVVFALVVERTRSLHCSIILHSLQNSVALLMLFLGSKEL